MPVLVGRVWAAVCLPASTWEGLLNRSVEEVEEQGLAHVPWWCRCSQSWQSWISSFCASLNSRVMVARQSGVRSAAVSLTALASSVGSGYL